MAFDIWHWLEVGERVEISVKVRASGKVNVKSILAVPMSMRPRCVYEPS